MKTKTLKINRFNQRIAILGAGNIGIALAEGFYKFGGIKKSDLILTNRKVKNNRSNKSRFKITQDNCLAVANCQTVIIAVQPSQLDQLLDQINPAWNEKKQTIYSLVAGVSIDSIKKKVPSNVSVLRVMPNTAVSKGESMTCISSTNGNHSKEIKTAIQLFNKVGSSLILAEELMTPATALCACGIAFFLRSIRAASQGGIQIGFHAEESLQMAAQTARGAATLLLDSTLHPESEIDRVTTPRGCTIAGLNRMEHEGLSSALIKGIVAATEIASGLTPYKKSE